MWTLQIRVFLVIRLVFLIIRFITRLFEYSTSEISSFENRTIFDYSKFDLLKIEYIRSFQNLMLMKSNIIGSLEFRFFPKDKGIEYIQKGV